MGVLAGSPVVLRVRKSFGREGGRFVSGDVAGWRVDSAPAAIPFGRLHKRHHRRSRFLLGESCSREGRGVLFPKRDSRKTSEWGGVPPDAAGIDVHSEFHFVAVPPGRDAEPVRRFGAFTEDLERLADGLQTCGVRSVAMESTGVYWIPLFELPELAGACRSGAGSG